VSVTADTLDEWEKRLNKLQRRISETADNFCDCQQAAQDDVHQHADALAEIQKEIHLAWVDAIAKEAP
jgi:hypothetical protein